MIKNFIGDKAFYKYVLAISFPIMLQNGITNFVNMLDNIMVGRIGSAEMTGVSVANQLIFIFNLCIFGAVSGIGIFGAQFFGKNDIAGMKYALRFKLLLSTTLTLIFAICFLLFGDNLISLYMQGEGDPLEIKKSFEVAKNYLYLMIIGVLPFALSQSYSSTLRETGQTVLPMKASLIAVLVNLCLNYVLIFGKFGAPKLDASGAAIATMVSRFTELAIIVIWTHTHKAKNPFIVDFFKSFVIPLSLAYRMFKKAIPLLLNETLWSMGVATVNQCYSIKSFDVVSASNISQTFLIFSRWYLWRWAPPSELFSATSWAQTKWKRPREPT